ncbi:3-beta hydroxysteroid dehydrogenase [Paraburkholderia ginsengiterrae]|uniref:3-beta hydroxysteroid dehydrogenase n=1 Tax=Paraburkholderia ginsengiterrae TaxID=1462993 RepID=A0A1A9MZZ0_9BURK|nr:NAD(P)H-binding protein [Paraburkholderia ginsengiterrae]OAJ54352.1 3-beta hydroxysteroid dehydrogenase [Paraburkholderia ginsengiterrae]OAJ56161.1 3-beta hydroxysteroid dehydrogenase [Paraburkholderia ginsengiterrae]
MSKQLKIALFGATGMIGSRIAAEAARRGHQVTALARNPARVPADVANLKAAQADLLDAASVTAAVSGHDVVASAYAPPHDDLAALTKATHALVDGVRAAGLKRLVVVGGAGSLEVAPGKQLVDAEGFPEAYKAIALAHRVAFDSYRGVTDLDWTFFAPAALIAPGERTGQFRTGANTLLADAEGNSRISAEDYAVAFVDELEQGRFIRQIATVAY